MQEKVGKLWGACFLINKLHICEYAAFFHSDPPVMYPAVSKHQDGNGKNAELSGALLVNW